MVDVDSFLKKSQPKARRSSLKPFEEAILKLRENGQSLQQIVEFLAESGQQTTIGNVSKFIKKATAVATPVGNTGPKQQRQGTAGPDETQTKPALPAGGKGSDDKKPGQPVKPETTFVTKTENGKKGPPTQQQLKELSRSNFDLSQYEDEE